MTLKEHILQSKMYARAAERITTFPLSVGWTSAYPKGQSKAVMARAAIGYAVELYSGNRTMEHFISNPAHTSPWDGANRVTWLYSPEINEWSRIGSGNYSTREE